MKNKAAVVASAIVIAVLAALIYLYGVPVSVDIMLPNGILQGSIEQLLPRAAITYALGATKEIYISAESLTEQSLACLNEVGVQRIEFYYENRLLNFTVEVIEDNTIYSDGFVFRRNIDVVTLRLVGYEGGTVAVIPDSAEGLSVTAIDSRAFEGRYIETIRIPASVIDIGDQAFYGVVGLRHLFVPKTVRKIGDGFIARSSVLSVRFEGDVVSPSIRMMDNAALSELSVYIDDTSSALYKELAAGFYVDGEQAYLNVNDRFPFEQPQEGEGEQTELYERGTQATGVQTLACDAYEGKSAVCEGDVTELLRLGYKPLPRESSEAEILWREARELLCGILDEDMSDYDKAKRIFDALCKRTSYITDDSDRPYAYVHRAMGAIVYRAAVCDGYARAYELLCRMAGLECVYIEGKINQNDTAMHAWNKVKLEGSWYLVDATFGDVAGVRIGSKEIEVTSYAFFLLSDRDAERISYGEQPLAPSTYKLPEADMPVFYSEQELYDYFLRCADGIREAGGVEIALLFELSLENNAVRLIGEAIERSLGEQAKFSLYLRKNDYLGQKGQILIIGVW